MTDLATALCRVAGCGGPASGVCLNGLSFDECPDVISPDGAERLNEASDEAEVVRTRVAPIFDAAAADEFLRARGGYVIAAVAGPDAGKTTLAATIYELAHRGRLDGIGFAGSETISGFEERCFLSRAASEEEVSDTVRTPTSTELAFLHIDLAFADGRRANLLLSDRSGEHFDDALDHPDRFATFEELARADAILLLLDAERLANSHHAEITRMRKIMLGLSNAGLLLNRPVHLVLTKMDKVDSGDHRVMVDRRAAEIIAEFKRRVPGVNVRPHHTACRAVAGSTMIGQGVRDLVAAFLPTPQSPAFATQIFRPTGDSGTALDRLMHQTRLD